MTLKRWLSGLLVFALCFTLLPAEAQAEEILTEDEEETSPTVNTPKLVFRWVDETNDSFHVTNDVTDNLEGSMGTTKWGVVCYVNEAGNETHIPVSNLTFPQFVEPTLLVQDNPCFFDLRFLTYGQGTITYRAGTNEAIDLPVSSSLPDVGYYSSATASVETFLNNILCGEQGEEKTAYLVWDPVKMGDPTDIKVMLLPAGESNPILNYAALSDDNTKTVLAQHGITLTLDEDAGTILVKATLGSSSLNLDLEMTFNGRMERAWLNLDINSPGPDDSDTGTGLRYQDLAWENNNWGIAPDYPLRNALFGQMGYSHTGVFYFYENGEKTLLSWDDLTFPTGLVTVGFENQAKTFLWINWNTVGSGVVTYQKNGTEYSLPISITLPNIGYYNTSTASVDAFLNNVLRCEQGQKKTAYLVWDPAKMGNPTDIQVMLQFAGAENPVLDYATLDENTAATLAQHGIKLTLSEAAGTILIEATLGGSSMNLDLEMTFNGRRERAWLNLDIDHPGTGGPEGGMPSDAMPVLNDLDIAAAQNKISDWRSGKENPTVTYAGKEYSFGIGFIEESGRFHFFEAGGGFGATTSNANGSYDNNVYLGVMIDQGTSNEQEAPPEIYDYISGVDFEIVDCINVAKLSDNDDDDDPHISVASVFRATYNGCETTGARIQAKSGGFAEALLRVTFTLTLPGQAAETYTIENVVHFAYSRLFCPNMSEVDTADELNEILSDKEKLLAWMENSDPTMYAQYQACTALQALNWSASLELWLPPVTYTDIIEVNLSGLEFSIFGSQPYEQRTTMPGMRLNHNEAFFMGNIDFVAQGGITQTYQNETFTCGILAYNDQRTDQYGDAFTVHNCTFTGFDYGIRNTPYGYVCAGSDNRFSNCEVGYLIDCAGKTGGNANSNTEHCIFENCKIAIQILGLPDYITPYQYRIYECDFINNQNKDLSSEIDGRLYCYFNYFGKYEDKNVNFLNVTSLDQIVSKKAGIQEKKDALIITNPRYAKPVNILDDGSNYLTIDNGRNTYIFNSQAGDMLLNNAALAEFLKNSGEAVTIHVMNDQEQVQATWNFSATEE